MYRLSVLHYFSSYYALILFLNTQMERVCENTIAADFKQNKLSNFVPVIRSGEWSDIGGRQYMEDAHVCIPDLAKNFGFPSLDNEVVSFYGVITCCLAHAILHFHSLKETCYSTHANLQVVYDDSYSLNIFTRMPHIEKRNREQVSSGLQHCLVVE